MHTRDYETNISSIVGGSDKRRGHTVVLRGLLKTWVHCRAVAITKKKNECEAILLFRRHPKNTSWSRRYNFDYFILHYQRRLPHNCPRQETASCRRSETCGGEHWRQRAARPGGRHQSDWSQTLDKSASRRSQPSQKHQR